MKRVRINAGIVGLVFKNGNYKRVIMEGTHWISFREQVIRYDLRDAFTTSVALEVLLEDESLHALLDVIDVKDHELVLVYERGNFNTVLTAGQYCYWRGLVERNYVRINLNEIDSVGKIDKAILSNYQLSKYIRTFEVASYEKAVLLIDDVYTKILDSGVYRFWKNDSTVKLIKADLRQLQLEVAGQELLTKDKAAIRINFYTQYKVIDIEKALLKNKDYEKQLYVTMQLALRSYVGSYSLDELLDRKEDIANAVFEAIAAKADALGVKVLYCGIRDVILTGEMKTIMNQVLIAQKQAQANTITRREETAATRSLLNTAKLMDENEMLFKLKEMEYVEKIADKIGEITVAGNGNVVSQLKDIFSAKT